MCHVTLAGSHDGCIIHFWRNPEHKKQTCVFARAFMRHRSGRVALTDFPLLLLASSTEEERLCGEAFVVSTSLVFSSGV